MIRIFHRPVNAVRQDLQSEDALVPARGLAARGDEQLDVVDLFYSKIAQGQREPLSRGSPAESVPSVPSTGVAVSGSSQTPVTR